MNVNEKIRSMLFGLLVVLIELIQKTGNVIGELATGGFLVKQLELPHGEPLGGMDSLFDEIKELAVKERDFLITESIDVQGTNGPYCNVKGIESLIFGRNTMRFYLADEMVCKIRNTRDEPGFVVTRGDSDEKIGRIEKMGDDYGFFLEPTTNSTDHHNETKAANITSDPSYICCGDFINRRFLIKNSKGENVAKIKKGLIAFPAFDHYVVRIAPGMDPILVLSCLCVIDEDLEDQIKEAVGDVLVGTGKVVVGTGKVAARAATKTAKFALDSVRTLASTINPFK